MCALWLTVILLPVTAFRIVLGYLPSFAVGGSFEGAPDGVRIGIRRNAVELPFLGDVLPGEFIAVGVALAWTGD